MSIAIRIAVMLALVGAIVGAHLAYSSHYIGVGEKRAEAVYLKQKSADDAKSTSDLAAANKRGELAELALTAFRAETDTKFTVENLKHEKALENERAIARAGRSGMRCPAATVNQDRLAGPPEDSTATGAPGNPKGTDLVPEAADAVLSIASNSANDVRDYNELLTIYNATVKACNVK